MPHPVARPAVDNAMSKIVNLPPELHQATESLIENLLASEAFLAYQQSQAKMNFDSEARGLLDLLSTLQTAFRHKQSANSVTQSDIDELRAIQTQVMENPIIMAYSAAQGDAVEFLREVNLEISQTLGMDFAALAKQSTC
jgi:cell fate (sporulation/competence/biofilm development) regulator YlbF (YheA/YmcA/DUF963 family)